jgi:light-regulated signal transduction histidine kinase (bacteriophytochrome)
LPEPPPTAAIEIQSLYADFAAMAEAIDRRSRYLRDFAHAVSHEFKTPLAGIRGGIELLEDHHGTMEEEDGSAFLANIAADADRLAQLVSRLLELARADMARPEQGETTSAVELRTILAGEAGIAVDVHLPDALPPIAVPPSTIRAVLASLVQNSIQAGASRIRAEGKSKRPACCSISPTTVPASPKPIGNGFSTFLHEPAQLGWHRAGNPHRAFPAGGEPRLDRAAAVGRRRALPAEPASGLASP